MKTVLLCILLLSFGINAQTSFFISPLVNYKIQFCNYQGGPKLGSKTEYFPEQNNIYPQNPYYSFSAKRLSTRPAIELGLRAGVSFQNKKHVLTLDWSTDEAGTMSKTTSLKVLNGVDTTQYKTYSQSLGYFQSGFVFHRFSLGYGIRLTKEKSPTRIYFTSDVSIAFGSSNSASWYYENYPENTSVYYHNNARWVSTEINARHLGVTSALFGLGIKGDIGFNTKKKPIYLFSLSINFRHGIRTLGYSNYITIIEDSGQKVAFSNSLSTNGSGLYFQFSRNIQLYPWKLKKGPKKKERM